MQTAYPSPTGDLWLRLIARSCDAVSRRFQPEGTDWVVERKKQHIKGKLQDKFPSAEACFNALDEDGGGSLDRC
jgi:hypothetical protein